MPRAKAASAADQAMVAELGRRGVSVSPRQLERWREAGLLPAPARTWLGRRGSASSYPDGAAAIAEGLAGSVKRGTPIYEAAVDLFARGLFVPEAALRSAFVQVLRAGRDELAALASQAGGRKPGASGDLGEAFEVADAASANLVNTGGPWSKDIRRRLRDYRRDQGLVAPVAALERSVWTLLLALAGGGSPALPEDARAELLAAIGVEEDKCGEGAGDRFLAFLAEATLEDLEAVAQTAPLAELAWARQGLHALVTLGRFAAVAALPDELATYGGRLALLTTAPVDKPGGFATAVLMVALAKQVVGDDFVEAVDAMVEQVRSVETEFGAEAVERFLAGEL